MQRKELNHTRGGGAFGLGLRREHYADFLERAIAVDFVEIISENYMRAGGRPMRTLDAIRERHPITMHGVSMCIGAVDGLDLEYLRELKKLAARVQPLWVSDHLCWTGIEGFNAHDLLPMPYSEEALDVVSANVSLAQQFLERPLLLENPSSYATFPESTMCEAEFLAALCERTGCELLLDVNNVYVSAANHGFDAHAFLARIPADRVRQVHLAGHTVAGTHLIDTHDMPVCEGVWQLYTEACRRFGPVPTMIERDAAIPPLDALLAELERAREIARVGMAVAA